MCLNSLSKVRVLACLLVLATVLPAVAHAQSSPFARQRQRLVYERSKLRNERVSLSVKSASLNNRVKSLNSEVTRINRLSAGIVRSAAVTAFKRKKVMLETDIANHKRSFRRYEDHRDQLTKDIRSYNRRINAYAQSQRRSTSVSESTRDAVSRRLEYLLNRANGF